MQPVKVGLAPIQRENTEYEFDIVLWLDRADHKAYASKDTTFFGQVWCGHHARARTAAQGVGWTKARSRCGAKHAAGY